MSYGSTPGIPWMLAAPLIERAINSRGWPAAEIFWVPSAHRCWPVRRPRLLGEAPFRWLLDSATQMLPLPVAYGTSNATLDDLERFKNRLLGCLLGVMFFCVILALLLSTSPQFKPCVHQTVTGSAALADRERVAEAHARCGRCPPYGWDYMRK